MRRTWLIDGYNVLNASPELKRAAESFGIDRARGDLIRAISDFARRNGCDCAVIFDGFLGGTTPAGVRVIASRGRTADDIIREESRRRGRGLTVVTDDLEILATARACLAATTSSRQFLEQLSFLDMHVDRAALRPHRLDEFRERSEKPGGVGDDDLDEWKKLFGV